MPALTLVDAQRDIARERCSEQRRTLGQPLVVQAVAALVHGSVEGIAPVGFAIACRESRVARGDAGAERVSRGIQPPGLKVKAHGAKHELADLVLPLRESSR